MIKASYLTLRKLTIKDNIVGYVLCRIDPRSINKGNLSIQIGEQVYLEGDSFYAITLSTAAHSLGITYKRILFIVAQELDTNKLNLMTVTKGNIKESVIIFESKEQAERAISKVIETSPGVIKGAYNITGL